LQHNVRATINTHVQNATVKSTQSLLNHTHEMERILLTVISQIFIKNRAMYLMCFEKD